MTEKKNLIEEHPEPSHKTGEVVYALGSVFRNSLANYFECERNLAKDNRYSMKVRREASLRATLLNYLLTEMGTILDGVLDANDKDNLDKDCLALEYCLEDLQLYLNENDNRYPAKEKYDA